MGRTVTVVLLDTDGESLGVLPAFETGRPWWQDASDVVREVRERWDLTVDVLRLLSSERDRPPGGAITYLAQSRDGSTPAGLSLAPVGDDLRALIERDEPLRAPYARPGGPAASLEWAAGIVGPASASQVRSWNLSAIWRLEARSDVNWLKQVPGWLGHEPAALRWLAETVPGLVPPLIAVGDEGRELLADVPGDDLYGADLRTRLRIVEQAHRFQAAASAEIDELLAIGVPDRRGPALTDWIRASLKGWPMPPEAADLLAGLDERMAAIAECGLPDTLGHGDAHPGNVRGQGDRLVFLDWSECYLGHPGFDLFGLVGDLPADHAAAVAEAWAAGWRRQIPGCRPARVIELLRPVVALRGTAVYAEFVANIEPTERPYHLFDVPEALRAAVDAAGPTVQPDPDRKRLGFR